MQPKSIATVVVCLSGTWLMSSTPAATEVISASVVSGTISEMLPTDVVLPTPKPPAMTILTGSGGGRCPAADRDAPGSAPPSGDSSKATDHPQQRVDVLRDVGVRQVDRQMSLGAQVAHEHPDDAEVQAQLGGDLGQSERF